MAMLYKFKSCGKCGGDLMSDGDEWRCFQCGTYYYPQKPVVNLSQVATPLPQTVEYGSQRDSTSRHTRTDIISSTKLSEHRWLDRNKAVIDLCKQGRTVQEIFEVVGTTRRQIREVKIHLRGMARKREPQSGLAEK